MSTTQSQTSVSQTTSHQSLLSTEDTSPFFSQEESPFVTQDISYENQSPLTSQGTYFTKYTTNTSSSSCWHSDILTNYLSN